MQHIAGNVNTKTIRKFPQVTEVCVHYIRSPKTILKNNENKDIQSWMRSEWDKTGLTLQDANEACNVSSAASRKYLAKDDMWYFPPPDKFKKLIDYANKHGKEEKPYFQINNKIPSKNDIKKLRGKFDCPIGVTNVWDEPPIHNDERIKSNSGEYIHLNQKPKKIMRRIIKASSETDDVVWEPFGGLCTAGLVAQEEKRIARCAEIESEYYQQALKRF